MISPPHPGPDAISEAINRNCPWSGKPIATDSLVRHNGVVLGFCNPGCRDSFAAEPDRYPEVLALIAAARNTQEA